MNTKESSNNSGDNRPIWLINVQEEGATLGILDVDGQQVTFTTVRKGLAPDLPYAVGYPNETALFISSDCLVEDAPHIMRHEVREKTRFSVLPEEERCKAALTAELDDVHTQSPNEYMGYVQRRRGFFDALVQFYKQPEQANAVSEKFLHGINSARDFIQSLDVLPPGTFSTSIVTSFKL